MAQRSALTKIDSSIGFTWNNLVLEFLYLTGKMKQGGKIKSFAEKPVCSIGISKKSHQVTFSRNS